MIETPYSLRIADAEIEDAREAKSLHAMLNRALDCLWSRSGAANVTSAAVVGHIDNLSRVYCYHVEFDSSAWTGR